jgi:hypothetical protein
MLSDTSVIRAGGASAKKGQRELRRSQLMACMRHVVACERARRTCAMPAVKLHELHWPSLKLWSCSETENVELAMNEIMVHGPRYSQLSQS